MWLAVMAPTAFPTDPQSTSKVGLSPSFEVECFGAMYILRSSTGATDGMLVAVSLCSKTTRLLSAGWLPLGVVVLSFLATKFLSREAAVSLTEAERALRSCGVALLALCRLPVRESERACELGVPMRNCSGSARVSTV